MINQARARLYLMPLLPGCSVDLSYLCMFYPCSAAGGGGGGGGGGGVVYVCE